MDRVEVSRGLKLDEGSHTYTLNGTEIPGVTRVLDANRFYEFPFVSPEDLAYKQLLGRHVHKAASLFDRGTLDWSSINDEVAAYVRAYVNFRDEHRHWTVLANEQILHHPLLCYAGTVDRVFDMQGPRALLDIKIGTELPAARLQTAAYEAMYNYTRAPNMRSRLRFSLHLNPAGHYSLIAHADPRDFPAFLACLTLYRWKH